MPRLLALLALAPFLLGQATPANEDTKVTWDPVTLDVGGNPETIARYELVVSPEGAPIPEEPRLLVTAPTVEAALGLWMLGRLLPAGNYEARARAVDSEGNVSDWTAPLVLAWPDLVPPAVPKNFRFLIEVGSIRVEGSGTITGI